MIERPANLLIAIIAAMALSAPMPAMAQGRSIMVYSCLGGNMRIDIPADPNEPAGHDCCKKGCHAANDRRKKAQQNDENCC